MSYIPSERALKDLSICVLKLIFSPLYTPQFSDLRPKTSKNTGVVLIPVMNTPFINITLILALFHEIYISSDSALNDLSSGGQSMNFLLF